MAAEMFMQKEVSKDSSAGKMPRGNFSTDVMHNPSKERKDISSEHDDNEDDGNMDEEEVANPSDNETDTSGVNPSDGLSSHMGESEPVNEFENDEDDEDTSNYEQDDDNAGHSKSTIELEVSSKSITSSVVSGASKSLKGKNSFDILKKVAKQLNSSGSSDIGESDDEDYTSRERGMNTPGSVVNTLRKYIIHGDGSETQNGKKTKAKVGSTDMNAPTGVMKVKYSKVPRTPKQPSWLYPYVPMEKHSVSYRGYPCDGPKSLKKSEHWKIQIVGASLGPPPEPLPQFPQEELLSYIHGEYKGTERLNLTEEQVAWNSGAKWCETMKHKPTSSYFYTSGYLPGSAVNVKKPFPETIYHTVVTGTTVEIPAVNLPGKLKDSKSKSRGDLSRKLGKRVVS